MALVLLDRVQQTGTANTTVSFTLTGSVVGFQPFTAIGNGNTTFYSATDVSGNWETGLGTYSTTGPTLTRTAVFQSSNANAAVAFSGAVNVWVDYPSSKSVNLDASGNVSALGTITSGTWNAGVIPVTYGGTGVSSSSGASSVVLRDANSNVTANNILNGYANVTAAAGTTVLTATSAYYQKLSGSTTQTFQLPVGTTMALGQAFVFDNDSSGTLTIVDNASATVDTVPSGGYTYIFCEDNTTSAGSWGKYALLPASYDFSTTSASFGNATISNAVWNGTVIGTAYGGTGLSGATPFTAANNAIYSTSATSLAAGTLPVLAGGTGVTTSTGSGDNVLSVRPTMSVTGAGFTLQDATDNTKQANFSLSNLTTGTTYSYTLPAVSGGTIGVSTNGNTWSATNSFSSTFNLNATTQSINLGNQTTGTWTAGGASSTGTMILGQSTVSQTVNISNGATASGSTNTINIGTAGLTGSTTNIAIGSTAGTSTNTFNGSSNFTGTIGATALLNLAGATSGANAFATNATTATLSIGGTSQTGTMAIGRSTVSQTVNLSNGVTASGSTNTINIGTAGAAGSTTAITIGSTAGTSTTTLNGTTSGRIAPRVSTTTSSATPTINTDTVDMYGLTAQAVDITSFTTNLSGTPTNGQKLWIYIVGTAARAITWGASFEASTVALPTTTVTTNRLDVGFVWNAATSKWRCVAVA